MQLHIEVTLCHRYVEQPGWLQAAVSRIMQVADLREADFERLRRDGVLSGLISSERVLALAVLEEVADFRLGVV